MAFIHQFPVGTKAVWSKGEPSAGEVRIDSHDHNGEVCWVTFLDGPNAGSSGPVFFTALSEAHITCPVCDKTSWHPKDVIEGYCGNCHAWTSRR
jgi:hypothetical protein